MSKSSSTAADATALMENLMLRIIQALVDYPDAVRIQVLRDNGTSLIRVHVSPTDIGKVVGKQGRTARSLRTVAGAIGMKMRHRFALDIVDEGG